jgi:hypothetical protein
MWCSSRSTIVFHKLLSNLFFFQFLIFILFLSTCLGPHLCQCRQITEEFTFLRLAILIRTFKYLAKLTC